jgi:hypothetical protein
MRLWAIEAAGVALAAAGVALVSIPAAMAVAGIYLVAAANVRGR